MDPRLDAALILNCEAWPSAKEKRFRVSTGLSRGVAAETERSHALQGDGQTAIGAGYCVEQVAVDVDIVAVSVESRPKHNEVLVLIAETILKPATLWLPNQGIISIGILGGSVDDCAGQREAQGQATQQ